MPKNLAFYMLKRGFWLPCLNLNKNFAKTRINEYP